MYTYGNGLFLLPGSRARIARWLALPDRRIRNGFLFVTSPLFAHSSTAYAADGVQMNAEAAWLRHITDEETKR